jgi:hypothetical protein
MIVRPTQLMGLLPVSIVVPAYNEGPNLEQPWALHLELRR